MRSLFLQLDVICAVVQVFFVLAPGSGCLLLWLLVYRCTAMLDSSYCVARHDNIPVWQLLMDHDFNTEAAFDAFSKEMVPSREGLCKVHYLHVRACVHAFMWMDTHERIFRLVNAFLVSCGGNEESKSWKNIVVA